MLKLQVHSKRPEWLLIPDVNGADVQIWRDTEGRACAYGATGDRQHWMYVPQIGCFYFGEGVEGVPVVPEASARPDKVLDSYYRAVLPMALQMLGREMLHASAIRTPWGVVALCAVSGTGKSTLAFGLSQRGWDLWADDAVAVEVESPKVRVRSLPFILRLESESVAYFGTAGPSTWNFSGWDFPLRDPLARDATESETEQEGLPLAAICILHRVGAESDLLYSDLPCDGSTMIETENPIMSCRRLLPVQAFPAVLTHAYCFSLRNAARKREMMTHYLALTERVPVLKISFQPGFQQLPLLLDQLTTVLHTVLEGQGIATE